MRRKHSLPIIIAPLTVLILTSLALSHDLWVVPSRFVIVPGASVSVALNTGDQFPVSDGAVKSERIERASLITAGGSTLFTAFRTDSKSTMVDVVAPRQDGSAIVEVVLKPLATKQPRASFDDFVKHEGLDAVGALLAREPQRRAEERRTYAKYAKTLLRIGNGKGAATVYPKPLGHRLEIVPEADPYSLKTGEMLPVRLYFDGRPLVGARVVIGSTDTATATQSKLPGVRTDAEGRARLPLDKKGGVHYIHTLHMIPAKGADVEWESFWATLTFEARRR